jgi:hypothetical protein
VLSVALALRLRQELAAELVAARLRPELAAVLVAAGLWPELASALVPVATEVQTVLLLSPG